MNILFVCHTQAQLILASGLAITRFSNCSCDLILYLDFILKDGLKKQLTMTFNRCLFLNGTTKSNTFDKYVRYIENEKLTKKFISVPYSKVFTVCDTIYPELKCMKFAYKTNRETEFCWLEDGITAYYQNISTRGGFDKNSILRFIKKIYFKYIKGLYGFYNRDFQEFGGCAYNKTMYCLYPEAVRVPYKGNRKLIGISNSEYLNGLKRLYPVSAPQIKEDDIILILDKISTYKYPNTVKKCLLSYINANIATHTIFYKLHPKESVRWPFLSKCKELDNNVAVESIYLSLSVKASKISVVGVKSTSLMSAVKLGFNTYSLFRHCNESNENLINFFSQIQVKLI